MTPIFLGTYSTGLFKEGHKVQALQKLFLFFLKPLEKPINMVNTRVKDAIVFLSFVLCVGFFLIFFNPVFDIRKEHTLAHLICSVFLVIMMVFSIKGELSKVKWNPYIFYVFFLSGLGILAISFLHPIGSGYRAFAMLMMFGFPCIYFVWNNRRDYESLYNKLSAATALVGIVYYVYCIYLAHNGRLAMTDGRVNGSFYDANMFSMIGMIAVCASLYMLLVKRDSFAWYFLTVIAFGSGISITLLGQSRLAVLVVLGAMFAFTIYYLKTQKSFSASTSWIVKFLRSLGLLASLLLFLAVGSVMLSINSSAIAENIAESETQNATNVTSETQVPPAEMENTTDAVANRFNTEGNDLDTYTAGRYHIWKGYAQFLNMTGNDFSKADWMALTQRSVKHAHNNFLEIAYRCGVPVACLHLLLEIMAGVVCIIWLFSPRYKDPVYMFCIAFMVCYAVQSLFDIATIPFERPSPFYFYMSMVPIFTFRMDNT